MLSSASSPADRFAAATGALLLQVGFIAAFFYAFPVQTPPRQLERELTFFLPRLPRIVPPPEAEPSPARPARPAGVTPPLFALPPTSVLPSPETPPAQALQNFGQALQDCTPGNYENLTPDRKAQCARPGEGVAIQQAPNMMGSPSHVKDGPRWANALTHEKSPVMLPGASNSGKMFEVIGMDSSGKVTGLAGGSSDPETWPTYDVKTYARGDFYKIEQAYDAWNKEHPDAHASAEAAGSHPQ